MQAEKENRLLKEKTQEEAQAVLALGIWAFLLGRLLPHPPTLHQHRRTPSALLWRWGPICLHPMSPNTIHICSSQTRRLDLQPSCQQKDEERGTGRGHVLPLLYLLCRMGGTSQFFFDNLWRTQQNFASVSLSTGT